MKGFSSLLFLIAGALGTLFRSLSIPIPYMLGGIVVTFVAKIFIDEKTSWPAFWRNLMLSVSGYEIGRSCGLDTLIDLSHQVFGVLSATGSILIVSLLSSYLTFRCSQVNLISCLMLRTRRNVAYDFNG